MSHFYAFGSKRSFQFIEAVWGLYNLSDNLLAAGFVITAWPLA